MWPRWRIAKPCGVAANQRVACQLKWGRTQTTADSTGPDWPARSISMLLLSTTIDTFGYILILLLVVVVVVWFVLQLLFTSSVLGVSSPKGCMTGVHWVYLICNHMLLAPRSINL